MAYSIEVDGERVSLRAACEARGLNYATVRQRICRGMAVEAALAKPARVPRVANHKAIANRLGVHEHTINERIARGWPIEKATSTPNRRTRRQEARR
jgi:hypothetical protein